MTAAGPQDAQRHREPLHRARTVTRLALGGFLLTTGVGHLSFAREGFRAQVPRSVEERGPLTTDGVVLASGVVELALGGALVVAHRDPARAQVGVVVAAFLAAVFPGNFSQWRHHRDALGLDSDRRRTVRLAFQPLGCAAALWSTGVLSRPGR